MSIEQQSADVLNLLIAIKKVVTAEGWESHTWADRKKIINRAAIENGYATELEEFVAWFQEEPDELDEEQEESD